VLSGTSLIRVKYSAPLRKNPTVFACFLATLCEFENAGGNRRHQYTSDSERPVTHETANRTGDLAVKLAALEAEVKGLRDLLAEVRANRDGLRQDHDDCAGGSSGFSRISGNPGGGGWRARRRALRCVACPCPAIPREAEAREAEEQHRPGGRLRNSGWRGQLERIVVRELLHRKAGNSRVGGEPYRFRGIS